MYHKQKPDFKNDNFDDYFCFKILKGNPKSHLEFSNSKEDYPCLNMQYWG